MANNRLHCWQLIIRLCTCLFRINENVRSSERRIRDEILARLLSLPNIAQLLVCRVVIKSNRTVPCDISILYRFKTRTKNVFIADVEISPGGKCSSDTVPSVDSTPNKSRRMSDFIEKHFAKTPCISVSWKIHFAVPSKTFRIAHSSLAPGPVKNTWCTTETSRWLRKQWNAKRSALALRQFSYRPQARNCCFVYPFACLLHHRTRRKKIKCRIDARFDACMFYEGANGKTAESSARSAKQIGYRALLES